MCINCVACLILFIDDVLVREAFKRYNDDYKNHDHNCERVNI